MPLTITDASEAFARITAHRATRWPDGRKHNEGRLAFRAQLHIAPKFSFTTADTILTIGSCFAREIEKTLVQLGFDVPLTAISVPREERSSEAANDIINKYVPQAMENELRWAFDPSARFPDAAYLEVGDGLWHDPHLGANIVPASPARVRERRAHVMEVYRRARSARIIVITLGLAEAWYDNETRLYLNAAPPASAIKRHPGRFAFHLLSYDDVVQSLENIHAILREHGNPGFKVLVTVSPVPFKATFTGADALQANTYSKSVLRAAAESFSRRHENVDYFPSYEIVTLSDRASAYKFDNIHVREDTVTRIMNQVVQAYTGLEVPPHSAAPDLPPRPDGSDPGALYGYAIGLAKARDYESAAQVMRNIAEMFGDGACGISAADFHLNLGIFLLRAKETVAGELEVRKAVNLEPDNARACYKHGLALARLKRHADAIDAFRRAIELSPGEASYHWRLGEELVRVSKVDEAKGELRKAIELDPDDERPRAALRALQP